MNIRKYTLLAFLLTASIVYPSVSTLTYNHRQHITYVGTTHSYDPKDAQYKTFANAWNDFLQKTGGDNCCVIIEQSNIPSLTLSSLEKAIHLYGDCGAAYYVAQNSMIPILAGDPLVRLGYHHLIQENKWDPDYIHYVAFIQQMELHNRQEPPSTQNPKPILERVEKDFAAVFPNTPIETMISLHSTITGKVFNPYDHHFFKFITYYPPMKSIRSLFLYRFAALKELQEIVFNYHLTREAATIALVKQQLLAGKHVFIVFGNAHEAFHIKALQAITQEKTT